TTYHLLVLCSKGMPSVAPDSRLKEHSPPHTHRGDGHRRHEAEPQMRPPRRDVAALDEGDHRAPAARRHPLAEIRLEAQPHPAIPKRWVDVRVVGIHTARRNLNRVVP